MTRWVVDTNVPIVANGRDDGIHPPSPDCQDATVRFLRRILKNKEQIILDNGGEILAEYRNERRLRSSGQPGVGDRFYHEVLLNKTQVERVDLPKRGDGEYRDLPQDVIDSGFDRSDRKFAALAKRESAPVVNAVDSDWLNARDLLAANGIRVEFLCGCNPDTWRVRGAEGSG